MSNRFRIIAALAATIVVSLGSLEAGYRLSDLRGPWIVDHGYSCGESKTLAVVLVFGAVVLIRAAWQSIRVDGNPAGRAVKLALACAGLALAGFTFSESEKAHDRFHQVHHQSESHR